MHVSLAEALEVRGGPLLEEEVWAVLSQSAESLQELFHKGTEACAKSMVHSWLGQDSVHSLWLLTVCFMFRSVSHLRFQAPVMPGKFQRVFLHLDKLQVTKAFNMDYTGGDMSQPRPLWWWRLASSEPDACHLLMKLQTRFHAPKPVWPQLPVSLQSPVLKR